MTGHSGSVSCDEGANCTFVLDESGSADCARNSTCSVRCSEECSLDCDVAASCPAPVRRRPLDGRDGSRLVPVSYRGAAGRARGAFRLRA
jgi:hypothetical protein